MNKLKNLATALLMIGVMPVMGQNVAPKSILLWPNGAPGSEGKTTPERVSRAIY